MSGRGLGPSVPDPLRAPRAAWRALFVVYAIILTTATHWPRLEIGSETMPAPDKLLHLVAFAVLAILFWRGAWTRSTWTFAIVLWSWAILDEVTQSLPILGRETSGADVAASLLGVTVIVIWRLALRPVGGTGNRARLASAHYAFEHLFVRRGAWVRLGLCSLLGAAVLGPLAFMVLRLGLEASPLDAAVLAVTGGGGVGAHVGVTGLWRREYDRLRLAPPCPGCGTGEAKRLVRGTASRGGTAPGGGTDPGDSGTAPCPACARPLWSGQWPPRLELPRTKLVRLATRPVLAAIGAVAGLFAVYLSLVALHPVIPVIGRLTRWYHGLTPGLRIDVDLALLAVAAAGAVALFRRRLALVFDGQHRRCMYCDQDVRAATIEGGSGRCSECGRVFHVPPSAPSDRPTDG
jgi:VanZ family protein